MYLLKCLAILTNLIYNTSLLHGIVSTEKELVTAPLDGLVLPGITRKSLIELAKKWV